MPLDVERSPCPQSTVSAATIITERMSAGPTGPRKPSDSRNPRVPASPWPPNQPNSGEFPGTAEWRRPLQTRDDDAAPRPPDSLPGYQLDAGEARAPAVVGQRVEEDGHSTAGCLLAAGEIAHWPLLTRWNQCNPRIVRLELRYRVEQRRQVGSDGEEGERPSGTVRDPQLARAGGWRLRRRGLPQRTPTGGPVTGPRRLTLDDDVAVLNVANICAVRGGPGRGV